MVRRRRGGVRVRKWIGLAAVAFVVTLAAVSTRVNFAYYGVQRWIVSIRHAEVCVRWHVRTDDRLPATQPLGWVVSTHPLGVRLWPVLHDWPAGSTLTVRQLHVPLWIPLLLVALPTAWWWHRDRPIPPHACPSCGYDLRGGSGGVCPECGARVEPGVEAPSARGRE